MIGMVIKLSSLSEVISWITLWKKWRILIFGKNFSIFNLFEFTSTIYFLSRRTVRDLQTGQDVVLSDKDVELIQRIESSKIPDSTYEEYAVGHFVVTSIFLLIHSCLFILLAMD